MGKAGAESCAKESGDMLFAQLAQLLVGAQVESCAVEQALELLCEAFSFECGMLYEQHLCGWFVSKEHSGECGTRLQHTLCETDFSAAEQSYWAQNGVLWVHRTQDNTPQEIRLLALLGADNLLMAPIVDADGALCGFAALRNRHSRCTQDESGLQMLKALLPMLTHYVSARMLQKKISQSREALEKLLDNTGIDIYVNDFHTHEILYVNESMAAPYGGKKRFENQLCWRVLFPGQSGPCEFCPQKRLLDENGLPKQVYSWDYQRAFDGAWFRVFSAAFYWEDGRLAHVVSSANITDNKNNEALIEKLANYDQLTGLPNRRMLVQECERRIARATPTEQGYTLFFDIDGFKAINDTLGHDAGDEFLVQLGAFFSEIPMLKKAIYRNGGDEFVAVLGGETISKDNVRSLAHFIHERFKKPWLLKGSNVFCGVSIGVACFPEDGQTPEVLLQKADQAMYRVKKTGGGGMCFAYQLLEDDAHT